MMKTLLKALIISLPLLFSSAFSYASECGEIAENSQVVTSIDDKCKAQILGFEATVSNLNKLFQAGTTPSGVDVVTGKAKVSAEASPSEILVIHGIGLIASVVVGVLVLVFFLGLAANTLKALSPKDKKSMYANGGFIGNLIKITIKMPLVTIWSGAVLFCLLASLQLAALLMYNIMVQNNKETQLTYASYASDAKDKAKQTADDQINGMLKYYSCVIDHDKRILFDYSVAGNNEFKNSDYHTCMTKNESKLDESKNSFMSRHLYKVQDCGVKYADVSNATCGFTEFKIDAQHVLKEKFIAFENRMLMAASDMRDYYCVNQVIVDEKNGIQNNCWKFNPVTYQIPLDDKGRLVYVDSAKSYAELQQEKDSLKAELISALEATAQENFKNYVPVPLEINAINYIKSKFVEDKLRRAVKSYNTQAMDYDFRYVDEFQYKKLTTASSSINNMINGGTSTSSAFNQEVNKLIDSITQKSQDEFIKDMVTRMAGFLGRDYVENMGLTYEEGGDYNVLSATIIAGQETATYLIVTSIALTGVEGGLSMIGTRSVSGKPDMTTILREKVIGFFAGYTKAAGLAIAGAVVGLVMLVIGTIVSQVMAAFQNVVKIAYLYELSFVIAGIDDKSGRSFNFEDIIRRFIILLYVLIIFGALIIEFELMFQVIYLLTDFAKDNFFLINKTAGYVLDSGNTVMSVIYDLAVVFAFHVIVISSMMMGMRTVNQSFHTALIQKLFGSQDLKSGLLLEDQQRMIQSTEGHFGSAAKNARNQRI